MPTNQHTHPTSSRCNKDRLFDLTVKLTSTLNRLEALQYLAAIAIKLTGAQQSAVGIMDSRHTIVEFVTAGFTDEQRAHLPSDLDRSILFPGMPATELNMGNSINPEQLAAFMPPSVLAIHNFLAMPVN